MATRRPASSTTPSGGPPATRSLRPSKTPGLASSLTARRCRFKTQNSTVGQSSTSRMRVMTISPSFLPSLLGAILGPPAPNASASVPTCKLLGHANTGPADARQSPATNSGRREEQTNTRVSPGTLLWDRYSRTGDSDTARQSYTRVSPDRLQLPRRFWTGDEFEHVPL